MLESIARREVEMKARISGCESRVSVEIEEVEYYFLNLN
jgi:hypothetical protein